MMRMRTKGSRISVAMGAAALVALGSGSAAGQATYEGDAVPLGRGTAHTIVRTDAQGEPASIGIVFTASALDGLPMPAPGTHSYFAYVLPMPTKGPATVIDHVVLNWEPVGHPPPGVYDVPHFDFHFYLERRADVMQIGFASASDSGDPSQQPPAELMPAGYIVPPGTAVPGMGVHAINPAAAEFQKQPFTATFIYGYYNRGLIFLEPMASLAYLKSKPSFSAPVPRPAAYARRGAYPSSYSVRYDAASERYEVTLGDLQ